MPERQRGESGRFTQKSDEVRRVRSIRLTDNTWSVLGAIAQERSITRADLLEHLVEEGIVNPASAQPITASEKTSIELLAEQVLTDPTVTRNGKDKGSVRRGLDALLRLLESAM